MSALRKQSSKAKYPSLGAEFFFVCFLFWMILAQSRVSEELRGLDVEC